MKVLFFAQSREAAGCAEGQLDAVGKLTEAEFWTLLVKVFPKMDALRKSARLARHEAYLEADDLIGPEDEIAIIPPVSGG